MKSSYCLTIDEKLPYYMEGELSSASKENIKRHIIRCPECQMRYENLKSTVYALRSIDKDVMKAPMEFVENVTARIMKIAYENFYNKKSVFLNLLNKRNLIVGAGIVAALVLIGIEISHSIHKKQIRTKLS